MLESRSSFLSQTFGRQLVFCGQQAQTSVLQLDWLVERAGGGRSQGKTKLATEIAD